jgi:hypothetical protein
MKFLFHKDNAAYDVTSKQFTFTLTENLQNPTTLLLDDVVFKASTMINTAYPQTLYLRSNALTTMMTTNHTIEIKQNGSKRRSNIIAVLNMYELGRYELLKNRLYRFNIDKHRVNKIFDFTFTDNATPIGELVGGPGQNCEFQITLLIK